MGGKLIILLFVLLTLGCTTISSEEDNTISTSALTSQPMRLLTILGSFNEEADYTFVTFYDDYYNVDVPVLQAKNDKVIVTIPPYFNPSGALSQGTVNIEVTQVIDEEATTHGTISGFTIQAPPSTNQAPGAVTLNYLNAALQTAQALKQQTSTEVSEALTTYEGILAKLTALINEGGEFYIGTIGNDQLIVNDDTLTNTDKLLLAMFNMQAEITEYAQTNSVRFDDAETSPGCMAVEAQSLAEAVESGNNPVYYTGYFNAPITSMNCKTAEAFRTGFSVIMGSSGAALSLVSLLGVPTALATGALLYVNTAIGGGLVLAGGVLGQTSEDAKALVIEGYNRLEDSMEIIKETILSQVIETPELVTQAEDVKSVYDGINDVYTALKNEQHSTEEEYVTLTVIRPDEYYGTFDTNPYGLTNWGNCGYECRMVFKKGTTVTLTPVTDNLIFTGWSGECTGTSTCTIIMNSDKTVTANYELDIVTLTVNRLGDYYTSFTVNPNGWSNDFETCTNTCTITYNRGETVTVTITPFEGIIFNGWSGACTGTGTCTVTLDENTIISASYSLEETTPEPPTPPPIGELSAVLNSATLSTSLEASGSWGRQCRYTLTVSGTAKGPVGARINVHTTIGEASFSSWTKYHTLAAVREEGQSETTNWGLNDEGVCMMDSYGYYDTFQVSAETSIIGPTGVYSSSKTETRTLECKC